VSGTLVIVRHGQSEWNRANRFTGWHDVPLTEQGENEATAAGLTMADAGIRFDTSHTSLQTRAVVTQNLALAAMEQDWLPVERTWRLNERHYGALQGLNKTETAQKHGEDQVKIWRRSYDTPPPMLEAGDERLPGSDPRYAHLSPDQLPAGECLKDTVERVLPCWEGEIAPKIKAGKRVLISAHGNSIRALVKHLDGVSDEAITGVEIPTGVPLVYQLDERLKPVSSGYLGDPQAVAAAQAAVAAQGKAK